MYFPLFTARRYLFSRKSLNVINIISIISIIGVSVGSLALIVILSVFNGLDGLVKSLFNTFDPDIKIVAAQGKTFVLDQNKGFEKVRKHKNVVYFSEIVEENALLEYNRKEFGSRQQIGIIKGVSKEFTKMSGIDTMLVEGEFLIKHKNQNLTVIGQGVAVYLSVTLNSYPLKIWVPRRGKVSALNPEEAFNTEYILPSGVFSTHQEFDSKYIITPIDFARKLLEYTNEVTAIELKLDSKLNEDQKEAVQKEIEMVLGKQFLVKNRYQQHELLYKIMKSEKWAIFLILSFILIIASFNVIASITMLIIDKRHDIETLKSLGATNNLIRKIFLFEGWMISFIGAFTGLILGGGICFLQKKFGLIELPSVETMIIKSYPVKMLFSDFVAVFITVALIGFLSSWLPVRYITKKHLFAKSKL